ncbi:MAG: hypothetical protein ACLVJ6_14750 [Merdibacter sp.]
MSWKQAKCSWSLAMGRSPDPYATDTLLQIGSPLLSAQERARLLSIGEQLSSLRVSGELREAGIDAYALPLHQSGIVTDDDYDYAHVRALRAQGVRAALDEHAVVVACGFIAASAREGDDAGQGRKRLRPCCSRICSGWKRQTSTPM